MEFAFDAEVNAPRGTLSREERAEIRDYVQELRIAAPDACRAVRLLAKRIQGRLLSSEEGGAEIALPDYGAACRIKIKVHETD